MIAIDWGSTSFRAYRLDAAGHVIETRQAACGLTQIQGAFEATLGLHLGGWDDPDIFMAGMVGSRSGWQEVPYVAAPAGEHEIAAQMSLLQVPVSHPALERKKIWLVPGVCVMPSQAAQQSLAPFGPDIMRGEETQILGILDALPAEETHRVCLPGTHCK
jgi:2-dehydro-3-deoxygalactonokinase